MPPSTVPVPPSEASSESKDSGKDLQGRLVDLEKRLQEEKEKVLLASLRSQEEAAYASKVESAIKDVQEKLRRDRRETELEESRQKLEARIRELDTRLVQERETWIATLQEQAKTKDSQDKEIETHFVGRVEEMERRWLEEKAHWQKSLAVRDEEIRTLKVRSEEAVRGLKIGWEEEVRGLKTQIEKLRNFEVEYQRVSQEKRFFEEKSQQLAPLQARIHVLEDKERDLIQARAEIQIMKEQAQTLRTSAREREERLLSDNERLHGELQTVVSRMRQEGEGEIRRFKSELAMANASILKLRAVSGTLERQRAMLKAQLEEMVKQKGNLQKEHDIAKAELLMIQQKWQENELRVRRESEGLARERIKDELRHEVDDEWRRQLASVRKELEEANTGLTQRFEARVNDLHGQVESLESRIKDKNQELVSLRETLTSLEMDKTRLDAEKRQALLQKEVALGSIEVEKKEFEQKATEEAQELRVALERVQLEKEEEEKRVEEMKLKIAALEEQLIMGSNEIKENLDGEQIRLRNEVEAECARLKKQLETQRNELTLNFEEELSRMMKQNEQDGKQLEEGFSQDQKKWKERLLELEKKFENRLEDDQRRLEASEKEREESSRAWLQEKAGLETTIASLREQLSNFSETTKRASDVAVKELQTRIRVLEEEIEDYRKPTSGLWGKFSGKPKPPRPPAPPDNLL